MSDTLSRYIQIGEWFFELKAVRALKVDQYGNPYQSIANCNINGNTMYIDGLLSKDDEQFTRDDYDTFIKFAQSISLEQLTYHRFQGGQSVHRSIKISPQNKEKAPDFDKPLMQLVE